MEAISVCNRNTVSLSQLSSFSSFNYTNVPHFRLKLSPSSSSRLRCSYNGGKIGDANDDEPLTLSRAYGVLGLTPQCSSAQIKAAFRLKVIISSFSPFPWFAFVIEVQQFCAFSRFSFSLVDVRLQVKQFHPDVIGDTQASDAMIRLVIQAYEVIVIINLFLD